MMYVRPSRVRLQQGETGIKEHELLNNMKPLKSKSKLSVACYVRSSVH